MTKPADQQPDNNIADVAASAAWRALGKIGFFVGLFVALLIGRPITVAIGLPSEGWPGIILAFLIGAVLLGGTAALVYLLVIRPLKRTPAK